MKKIEINDVEYQIPENYSEINFDEFEKIQILIEKHPSYPNITHDLAIECIEFLTKIDRKILIELTKDIYISIYNTISFIFSLEELEKIEFKNYVKLNSGETWYCSEDNNVLVKEYIDRDYVLNEFPEDKRISGMIAIFLRPKNTNYDSEFLEERINIIKKQPSTLIFPFIAFFLHKREVLKNSMNLYLAGLQLFQMREEEMQNYLHKNGGGRMSFINWRTMICKNLMNYLNAEYLKSSTYYHTLQMQILQTQTNYKSNNNI